MASPGVMAPDTHERRTLALEVIVG